ncbi:tetratricopeptide repeat protein [Sulfitobacter aestuariivivens]|uniref:Tetratricopeptide repeat protein n=1 Tax=Sulfitobacter aestuariivivens TaxID=2766981 RepID=A0A927D389_9RHOB|nr:tetratricopeptide repeat protein [Sulfitobacter aestuariivivens]MBD3662457.1 tetratricopeptide repeat protein [Sulfitobacter aestuariivivens]
MSDTDSFIDEVNEEVRRDRLYGYLRRYGWIAILAIVLIVGGAAWSEYQKAQARAQAEALGDAMLAALANDEGVSRVDALEAIDAPDRATGAVLRLLTAAEQADAGRTEDAVATLDAIASDGDVSAIYRQIAQFKSLTLQSDQTPVEDRLLAFESMAQPGNPMRLLAEEQIALIEIAQGKDTEAIARYQAIQEDAEVSSDLQQRALQVIVALGGEPELADDETSDAGTVSGSDN